MQSAFKRLWRGLAEASIGLLGGIGFCLCASAAPPGDNFEAPYVISQKYGSLVVDSAVTGTAQPNEPLNGTGHTVWFRWTAPQDGPVAFDTMTGYFPTIVTAYTGDALDNLALVSRLPDPGLPAPRANRFIFTAATGKVYQIQVDASTTTLGRFVFKWWQGAPPNDDFANADHFSSGVYFYWLSSVNATKEPGEPNHAGNAGGRSIWIPVVGEMNRGLSMSTQGSEFDTLLAVYTGDSLTNPTEVASSNDVGTNRWSQVHIEAVRDTRYWVVVDGVDGDGGNIYLDIRYDRMAPRFTRIVALQDEIELDMLCNDDRRFLIESSIDLKAWIPWYSTPQSEYGELRVRVPAGTNSAYRFFRARQLPEND